MTAARQGVLMNRSGKPQDADRPHHMFTRWYGFAFTFRDPEISGQP
jgi:hypothetical protein